MKRIILIALTLIAITSCQQRKRLLNLRNLELLQSPKHEAEVKEVSNHSTAIIHSEAVSTEQNEVELITLPTEPVIKPTAEKIKVQEKLHTESSFTAPEPIAIEDFEIVQDTLFTPATATDSTETKTENNKLTKDQTKLLIGVSGGFLLVMGALSLGASLLFIVFIAALNNIF